MEKIIFLFAMPVIALGFIYCKKRDPKLATDSTSISSAVKGKLRSIHVMLELARTTVTYFYDGQGRLSRSTRLDSISDTGWNTVSDTQTYSYNATTGNMSRFVSDRFTHNFFYDGNNHLTKHLRIDAFGGDRDSVIYTYSHDTVIGVYNYSPNQASVSHIVYTYSSGLLLSIANVAKDNSTTEYQRFFYNSIRDNAYSEPLKSCDYLTIPNFEDFSPSHFSIYRIRAAAFELTEQADSTAGWPNRYYKITRSYNTDNAPVAIHYLTVGMPSSSASPVSYTYY